MSQYQDIAFLGEWEGYRVKKAERKMWGARARVVINLEEEAGHMGVCEGCGRGLTAGA